MEKRLLLAAVLSLGVLFVWESFAAKNAPKRPPAGSPVPTAVSANPPGSDGSAGTSATAATPAPASATPATLPPVNDTAERTVVLANDLVRATFSNRGGVLTSYVLLKHHDDAGGPLELVRPVSPRPFALLFPGRPDLGAKVSGALFAVDEGGTGGRVARFRFSDGTVSVVKEVRLDPGYVLDVKTSVAGPPYRLSLGTGLRAESEKEAANPYAPPAAAVAAAGGGLKHAVGAKLEKPESWSLDPSGFVGLQDNYFLAALVPSAPSPAPAYAEAVPQKDAAGKATTPLVTAGVIATGDVTARAYFGPKEVDALRAVHAGLERTVDFGWYGILAGPLLWLLRGAYRLVGNWGVAILLVTLLIRILLFPLMHKSYASMKKMQKLQPKMNAIRDKYRKAKTDATQRQKMNEEMMKLYQAEGYNPMSGCFPILLQLPILVAFYNVLSKSIELRHAPFVFWIKDLSAVDPTYVLVGLMVVSMYVQQAMTPTTVDPAQKKLFMAMPLLWGFFMRNYPSGLILYWLFSNILTVFQQMIINRIGSRDEPEETGGKAKKLRQARA